MGLKFTHENITRLGEDEVFVFGSNLYGSHGGGAARMAYKYFGAKMGQGVGLQGQSYAIPTMQGGVETIKPYVDEFIDFARGCDQTTFLVTRIGCGIAGFRDAEIAPLFAEALGLYNVRLPRSFAEVIVGMEESYLPDWMAGYSSFDMMADLLVAANRMFHYGISDREVALDRLRENLNGFLRMIPFVCDFDIFSGGEDAVRGEWIDERLREAAGKMEIEGLLRRPLQRYGLMLAAGMARCVLSKGEEEVKPEVLTAKVREALSVLWADANERRVRKHEERAWRVVEKALSQKWDSLCEHGRLDEGRLIEFFSDPELRRDWEAAMDVEALLNPGLTNAL